MNLFDSSFLCLDIGTYGVRGIAHRVRGANIDRSAFFTCDSYNTTFAIKTVIDELERQIGTHFDSAYITGNFGPSEFSMVAKNTIWGDEHKITINDVRNQISQISGRENYHPIHTIPLRYDSPNSRNMTTPIGHIDRQLISAFATIYYSQDGLTKIYEHLRGAHIQPNSIYDPQFLQNAAYRTPHQTTMFIDFGAQYTSASIWTDRGPVWHAKIQSGGTDITNAISEKTNLNFDDANRIKHQVASLVPKDMDRFTPADTAFDFSRSDINDIIAPILVETITKIKETSAQSCAKYQPGKIIITGGACEIEGLRDYIENTFATITEIIPVDASVRALSEYIWKSESSHRQNYIARTNKWRKYTQFINKIFTRKRKHTPRFIPIMPSTLCFDMRRPDTYSLFKSGDISMIHVDIMDGFYVDRIAGSIEELKTIRSHTKSHLHVHLMTESPNIWATDAIAAGADTIILSTNTSGLRSAIRNVRASGRRVGVALHPDSAVSILKPILRDIDEVMVMSVAPGASGQQFQPDALHKISILAATRKKYGLKYTISVDGGINDKNAQLCWDAGADLLVSGSYLSRASDFPLAVQKLLPQSNTEK